MRNNLSPYRLGRRKAALSLLASAVAPVAFAGVSANTNGTATQNGNNNAVTISLSGSTAMRNFTTSQNITFLNPGDSITLNNGLAGAPVIYTAPAVSNEAFQLASGNFTAADVGGPFPSGATNQTHSALRLEWHEQGSVEGILELANDQIGYLGGGTGTALINPGRDANAGNPIWVNRNKYTAATSGSAQGLTIAPSTYNTYTNYDATGLNLQGGQNRVQMAISDVNAAQGFAVSGANGAVNSTPGTAGYGKGNNNLGLQANTLTLPTNGAAIAHGSYQFNDQSVLNMSTDKLNPKTGTNYTTGAWNTGGTNNLQNTQIAVTATTFSANPGTGLDKLNRTDAQWLQTTGRFSNGAGFNFTTRDVGSGTRNVAANNTGIDPTFAVGVNDDGNGNNLTPGNTFQEQLNIGSAMRFSNKTAGGGQLRPTIQNNRMALGTLSISDALSSVSNGGGARPLRALSYSDSADGSSGYVTVSASSITDGTYAIWQNETYVTVKDPTSAASVAIGNNTAAWAAATDATTGIKGDNAGNNVAAFRKNILVSTSAFPNTNSVGNAADGLLNTSFILPQMMQVTKPIDGVGLAVSNGTNYNAGLRDALVNSSYANAFNADAPGAITKGSGATYGSAGNNSASFVGGTIKITAQNYLFGNFNQNATRDFASLQSAVVAAKALEDSGAGVSGFSGSANATVIPTGIAALDNMTNQAGGVGATKGDLIVLGDFAGSGRFDGQSLYLFAKNAALSDSTNTASLTGGAALGDSLRTGVSRKNDALDFLQSSTNVTSAMRIAASADLTADPTGANAFNKFDINRDGRISRNDAAIVDKFINADKTNLSHQLAATIGVDGSASTAVPQQTVSLYDVGLLDGQNKISTGKYSVTGTAANPTITVDTPGDFALIRQALGSHLRPGDTQFRGKVDQNDLTQIVSHGFYRDHQTTHQWSDGDFTGDGAVDQNDLTAIVSAGTYRTGNYDGGAPSVATPSLTGKSASPSAVVGSVGDGRPLHFVYTPSTGDLKLQFDNLTGNLQVLDLISTSQQFKNANANAIFANAGNNFNGPDELYSVQFTGSFPDGLDLGNILATNLNPSTLAADLTLKYAIQGQAPAFGDLIVSGVPEPTTLSLVGLAAMGLLARRRHCK